MLTLTSLSRADRHMLLNAGNDVQCLQLHMYTYKYCLLVHSLYYHGEAAVLKIYIPCGSRKTLCICLRGIAEGQRNLNLEEAS